MISSWFHRATLGLSLLGVFTLVACGSGGSNTSSSSSSSSSAASSTGSSSSSSTSSSGASVPPGKLGCSDGLICESFEKDALTDLVEWSAENSEGKLSLSEEVFFEHGFGGNKSLKVEGVADNNKPAMLRLDLKPYPDVGMMLSGRMMVYLERRASTRADGEKDDFTFFEASGDAKQSLNVSAESKILYRYRLADSFDKNGTLMGNYETTGELDSDCWAHDTATVLPIRKWSCVRWEFDAVKNELEYWLENEKVVTVNNKGEGCATEQPPLNGDWIGPETFTQLRLGIEHYGPEETRVMYIDDIIIDKEFPECPQPPSISEQEKADRIAAGSALFSSNGCAQCHGTDGKGGPGGGGPIVINSSEGSNICNICTNGTYANMERQIEVGNLNAGGTMRPCTPTNNCAKQLTDYVWGELNGFTLTPGEGGTRP